jgi:hypothetical protein
MDKHEFVTDEIEGKIKELAKSIASIKKEDIAKGVNPVIHILTLLSEDIVDIRKTKLRYFRNVHTQEVHDSVVLLVRALNISGGSGSYFSLYAALQNELEKAKKRAL